MPVLHLIASSPDDKYKTTIAALLDPCSTRTLCTPSLLSRLHVPTKPAPMQLDVAGKPGHHVNAKEATITLSTTDGRMRLLLPRVYAIPACPPTSNTQRRETQRPSPT